MCLSEGLRIIGQSAFAFCEALRSVTLPSSVTELGKFAFDNCKNLAELQLNEGLQIICVGAFQWCGALRSVTLPSTVTVLDKRAFHCCRNLAEVHLNEGLQNIGAFAFEYCLALRIVTVPSTVTKLGEGAFSCCRNLIGVQLKEGLRIIGHGSFTYCSGLSRVIIPSTVIELGGCAFCDCNNLSEVILMGGERLLDQEFFSRGIFSKDQGLVNQEALYEMLFDELRGFAFLGCPLTTVKISISWAVSERMARLPHECMLSVEERIHNLRHLELLQNGDVLTCFPVFSGAPGDEAEDVEDTEIQDTNLETAKRLYQLLQLIAFHELKESSIVIELAMWKSRIDEATYIAREDCRVAIPDPGKTSIMEYVGFAGFLKPAIEGG
ncbi:hypothetical protein THAOC_14375 [Thalassiosira oceanica]|uniref:Uncharacterized protein n=1 Tax=Thalassiosira oceanica TaxID=159749 RepID=K0T330_THAOC|nr:hypothetical protein THAOC_14375 [Thalassiosira oceanica]|eukprot:EJK64847.1 hypothetical protein THAOC_14375 [Thalassiosira oceanica]